MRKFLIAVLFLLATGTAHAQFVTVSGQVMDINGSVYSSCVMSITFVPSPSATQMPTLGSNNQTFPTQFAVTGCDTQGNFSVTLADNNLVVDGHPDSQTSQWAFKVSTSPGAYTPQLSFTYTTVITGVGMNLTTAFQTVAVQLPITTLINSGAIGDLPNYISSFNLGDSHLVTANTPQISSPFTTGSCIQATGPTTFTTASGACGTTSGTLTSTGSPISGQASFWSGSTSLTGSTNWLYSASSGHTLIQGANNTDAFFTSRFTDSSPLGNFLHFQNAAKNADLFRVDIMGNTVATSFTGPLTGTASTATAFASLPTLCTGVNFARGVIANGNASCAQPSNVTGNAATSTALAATPTQCGGGNPATGIAASGNANCAGASSIPIGDLVPGINGQCHITTGGASVWGSCSGSGATVASGTASLGTGAIASGTCAGVVTVSATSVATTDNVQADFNADPTGTTGYAPSANGMLTIIKYPTTNNVNFKVCNNTANSITPGAITLNWRVMR